MVLGVHPKRRRSLEAAAQRNQEILRNVVSSEAELFSFRALDSETQVRLIEGLLNPQICCSRNRSHLLEQRVRIHLVPCHVVSHNLNIYGSWQAKIQNLANHIGRQKRKAHTRELSWQSQTELVNVIVRRMVLGG